MKPKFGLGRNKMLVNEWITDTQKIYCAINVCKTENQKDIQNACTINQYYMKKPKLHKIT